jgi:hypothetical protein
MESGNGEGQFREQKKIENKEGFGKAAGNG